jgi:hypothetical protein
MAGLGAAERVFMVSALERVFPGLGAAPYRVTSPRTIQYNCIAWAAGDVSNWWWPTNAAGDVQRFWPAGVPREETLAAFVAAFTTLNFASCDSVDLELGFEKIAFFADARGVPTHAARQLPTGVWTSKLGEAEDIEHELRALEGEVYGRVALILKRAPKGIASIS